ncbi:hypothetical protein ACOSQ4_019946 [Xanthoceras sorbifolium]
MRREATSNFFSSFLLSLLIFLLIISEIHARKLQRVGDPAGCGDPDFELSCQNDKTILEILSGKYYVKRILHAEHIISVVDVNLANGSCGLPHKSLSQDELQRDSETYRVNGAKQANFLECSSIVSDRPAYTRLPCLNGNQSYAIYVNYGGSRISEIPESCSFISTVPIQDIRNVKNPSYEAIMKLLESGFDLVWSVECRNCKSVGGFCDFYSFVGAIGLIVLLIHRYRETRKTVDNVEKFLHNQQTWMPKRYSYIEIIAITNHFREKLGQGGFGSVYKGQLINGRSIAVKVLENSKFRGEDFINEVSTIVRIHHSNVYMSNGSLDRHIFLKEDSSLSFSWEKLHEIALGSARGIEYLHNGCDVCILYFDIKPHNILLDNNFIPKLADFGLAKLYPKENDFISVSTTRGTIGYKAPELISRNFGIVSCKSDVYSFGMLLLEMAGGRRNSFAKATRSSKAYFPSWVYDKIINGRDLELRNVSEIESRIARKLCIIGLWCIQVKPTDRPSITKVVEMLDGSIDDLQMPPKPFFSSSRQYNSIREIQSDSSTELLKYSDSIGECSYIDHIKFA